MIYRRIVKNEAGQIESAGTQICKALVISWLLGLWRKWKQVAKLMQVQSFQRQYFINKRKNVRQLSEHIVLIVIERMDT